MKTKYIMLAMAFFGILFASCSQKEKSLKEYMTDSWETKYMKIEMPTFKKSDSTHIFEDKFENNPVRRVQSLYKSDGTFSTWSLNRKGERYGNSNGTWKMKGDSLFIEFFYDGRNVKEAYHIEKIENGFKGVSKYDWDKDGAFDDLLTMKTKRIDLGE